MEESSEPVLSFTEICDLLGTLQKLLDKFKASGPTMKKRDLWKRQATYLRNWVDERESKVKKNSTTLLAFLSLVLPFWRVDRHYFIKEHNLSFVLARAIGVGPKAVEQFKQWRTTDGDYGVMAEKILKQRVSIAQYRSVLTRW